MSDDTSQTLPPPPDNSGQVVTHDIEALLLQDAFARRPRSLWLSVVLAPVCTALIWNRVPNGPMLLGMFAILLTTGLGFLICHQFRRTPPENLNIERWKLIFFSYALVAGAAWGLGATLTLWQGVSVWTVAIVGTLLCVCAVAMVSMAAQVNAMRAYVLATLLPPALSALYAGSPSDHIVAAMFVLGSITLVIVGRDSFHTLRASIESKIQLQAILDTALDAVVSMDAEGRITDWNHRAQLMLGWRADEVKGQLLDEVVLIQAPSAAAPKSGLARILQNTAATSVNHRVEMRARHRDGTEIAVEVATHRLSLGGRVVLTASIADISEHKAAVERLALFRRVFEASKQCIVISDATGRGVYQNRAHSELMGYSNLELVEKRLIDALVASEADDRWAEIKLAIAQTGKWEGALKLRRKGGSQFVSASKIGSITDERGAISYVFNIFTDATQDIARQQELTHAKDAAEQANLAKSDFLSSMSHELRTPLNAILGFAQIMQFDEQLSAEHQDSIEEILTGGQHLLKLINEVLDLAKLESGNVVISLEPVRLVDAVNDCWKLLRPVAATRELTLHLVVPDSIYVRADRVRLRQVLLNLISNAINFNRVAGDIAIRSHVGEQGQILLDITDSGEGIAPSRLPDLFKAFNRGGSLPSQTGGAGVGLAIAQRLMHLMDGNVGVNSHVGIGTTFWIELQSDESPVADVPAPADDVAVPQFDEALHLHTVLCIDDNPVNLKLVSQLLSKRPKIHLITAHTPGLGIQLALGRKPDLILLDINMPGMDGYQVLEVLKTYSITKSIPIIAVTANAAPKDIQLGGDEGLVDYFTKPLEAKKFLSTVDHWLEKGRLAKARSSEHIDLE